MAEVRNFTTFFESIAVTSTTTGAGADVVYTVPEYSDVELTFLACTNGGAVNTINILIYHADNGTYGYVRKSQSVADNSTHDVITSARIYLHAGDKVLAYKGGGTFDVAVSGRKFYNSVRSV